MQAEGKYLARRRIQARHCLRQKERSAEIYLGTLIKFHYKRTERNKMKLHRIEKLEQRKSNYEKLTKNIQRSVNRWQQ